MPQTAPNYMIPNYYDVSEMQDLEQIRMELTEENYRIKAHEDKLNVMFERLKYENGRVRQERQDVKRWKE